MRKILSMCCLFLCSQLQSVVSAKPNLVTRVIGGARPAQLLLPKLSNASEKIPLVLFLHGYTSNSDETNAFFNLSQKKEELKFALVLADGTRNSNGDQFWNATPECCDFEGSGVDDSGYLASLIQEAKSIAPIDATKVFVMGHSNGGFMSYRMACDHPQLIRGIVSVSGAFFKTPSDCKISVSKFVNVLQIHGNLDHVVPYAGNELFPTTLSAVEFWSKQNRCRVSQAKSNALDLVIPNSAMPDRIDTDTLEWPQCVSSKRVGLWTIKGTEHLPYFNSDWLKRALEFVSF
jgi:polyhydroxybutyrate depolymerase